MSEINFLSSSGGDKEKNSKSAPPSSTEVEFHAPTQEKKEPNEVVQKISGWFKKLTTKKPKKVSAKKKEKKPAVALPIKNAPKQEKKKDKKSEKSAIERASKPTKNKSELLLEKDTLQEKKEVEMEVEKEIEKPKPEVVVPAPVPAPPKLPVEKPEPKPREKKKSSLTRLKKEKPTISPPKKKVAGPAQSHEEIDGAGIGVNLMPWQDPAIKRNRVIRWVLVLISIGVIVVWGTMVRVSTIGQETRISGLEERIAVLDHQLNNIDAELLAQGSTLAINQKKFLEVYNDMPLWTKFLAWLEETTDESVSYVQMKVTSDNKVFLETHARDYDAAARQWLAFQTATSWIEAVGVSEFTEVSDTDEGEGSYVEFSVELDISQGALRRDSSKLGL